MGSRAITTESIEGLTGVGTFMLSHREGLRFPSEFWVEADPMTITPRNIDAVGTSAREPNTLRLLMTSGFVIGLRFEDEDAAQDFRDILEHLVV